jgi:hypothetical protein
MRKAATKTRQQRRDAIWRAQENGDPAEQSQGNVALFRE